MSVDAFFDKLICEVSGFPMEQTKVPLELLAIPKSQVEVSPSGQVFDIVEAEFLMNWELFMAVRMENATTEEDSNIYLIHGEETYQKLLLTKKIFALETSKVRAIVFTVPRDIYLAVRTLAKESSARQYLFDKLLLRVVKECHYRTYKWRTYEVLKNLRATVGAHFNECWYLCKQEFWPRLIGWKRVLMMSCAPEDVFNETLKYVEIQKGQITQTITEPTKDWQSVLEICLHMILSRVLEYGPEAVSVYLKNNNNRNPTTPATLVTRMSKHFPDKKTQIMNSNRSSCENDNNQKVKWDSVTSSDSNASKKKVENAENGSSEPPVKVKRVEVQENVGRRLIETRETSEPSLTEIEPADQKDEEETILSQNVQGENAFDDSCSFAATTSKPNEINYSQLLENSINSVAENRNIVTMEIPAPNEERLLRLERLAKAVETLERYGHTVPKRIVADIVKGI